MREATIETTFGSSEWFASICDTCCQTDKWVVLLADERVCRHCLENSYDEEGEPIDFSNERIDTDELVFDPTVRQKVKNAAIGLLVAGFTAGFFVAAVLFSNEEISAVVRRLI